MESSYLFLGNTDSPSNGSKNDISVTIFIDINDLPDSALFFHWKPSLLTTHKTIRHSWIINK